MGGAIQTGLSLPLVTPSDRSQLRDCLEAITSLATCVLQSADLCLPSCLQHSGNLPHTPDAVRFAGKSD